VSHWHMAFLTLAKEVLPPVTAARGVFIRLLQISWNLYCCSVVHLLEPKF
jgi:hypothetical protein